MTCTNCPQTLIAWEFAPRGERLNGLCPSCGCKYQERLDGGYGLVDLKMDSPAPVAESAQAAPVSGDPSTSPPTHAEVVGPQADYVEPVQEVYAEALAKVLEEANDITHDWLKLPIPPNLP